MFILFIPFQCDKIFYASKEIDIVISRDLVLESKWKELYDEVAACRKACGEAQENTDQHSYPSRDQAHPQ